MIVKWIFKQEKDVCTENMRVMMLGDKIGDLVSAWAGVAASIVGVNFGKKRWCVEKPAYPVWAKNPGNSLKIPPNPSGNCGKLLFSEKVVFARGCAMVLASNDRTGFLTCSHYRKEKHYEGNDEQWTGKRFYDSV